MSLDPQDLFFTKVHEEMAFKLRSSAPGIGNCKTLHPTGAAQGVGTMQYRVLKPIIVRRVGTLPSSIIRDMLRYEFDADVTLLYDADGLSAELRCLSQKSWRDGSLEDRLRSAKVLPSMATPAFSVRPSL